MSAEARRMPVRSSPHGRRGFGRAPRTSRAESSACDSARMAPRVGLEPTTTRLTAGCSTIELPGSAGGKGYPAGASSQAAGAARALRGPWVRSVRHAPERAHRLRPDRPGRATRVVRLRLLREAALPTARDPRSWDRRKLSSSGQSRSRAARWSEVPSSCPCRDPMPSTAAKPAKPLRAEGCSLRVAGLEGRVPRGCAARRSTVVSALGD
jgi:hypothetical protein